MMEIQGMLFFRGISGDDVMEFIEEHNEEIADMYSSPLSASSIRIGNIYIEYRPDTGDFDCCVPVMNTIEYGRGK